MGGGDGKFEVVADEGRDSGPFDGDNFERNVAGEVGCTECERFRRTPALGVVDVVEADTPRRWLTADADVARFTCESLPFAVVAGELGCDEDPA